MYSLSFLGLLSILGLSTTHVTSAKAGPSQHQTFIDQSYWYDWGWYGGYPRNTYESFGAQSPLVNILKQDARCDDGYTFIEPRGTYVDTPGPVILDNSGNLVWMQTMWGQTMDLKVQHYQGKDYITFWRGTDSGTFGSGSYIMVRSNPQDSSDLRSYHLTLYKSLELPLLASSRMLADKG